MMFDFLAFHAASVDSTAQTGHTGTGTGDWQEEAYQMVMHTTTVWRSFVHLDLPKEIQRKGPLNIVFDV
jgi:hypothetical protein